jgi:hypothetical protein
MRQRSIKLNIIDSFTITIIYIINKYNYNVDSLMNELKNRSIF